MSRQIKVTVSDAVHAGLRRVAMEDAATVGGEPAVKSVVAKAITRYLHSRGVPKVALIMTDAEYHGDDTERRKT